MAKKDLQQAAQAAAAGDFDLEENTRQLKEAQERLNAEEKKKTTAAAAAEKMAAFLKELREEERAENDPFFEKQINELAALYNDNPLGKHIMEQELSIMSFAVNAWRSWLTDPFLWAEITTDSDTLQSVLKGLSSIINDFNGHLNDYTSIITSYDESLVKKYKSLIDGLQTSAELLPYFVEELKKPIYGGKDPRTLMAEAEKDADGKPVKESLIYKAKIAAIAARAAADKAAREKAAKNKGVITPHKINDLYVPTDKVNSKVWGLSTEGNLDATFDIIKADSEKQTPAQTAAYSVSFDLLDNNTTHRLTPFDKRTIQAVFSIIKAGDVKFSLTHVYEAMGCKKGTRPASSTLEKINNTLTKMGNTRISLSFDKGSSKYQNYSVYDAAILEFERVSDYNIKGNLTNVIIHVLRTPRLLEFAEKLKQLTTVNKELYQDIELNLTDENIALEDYIIRIILWKRKEKEKSATLNLETICEEAHIEKDNRMKIIRAVEKVNTILKACKRHDYISSFSYKKDKKQFHINL